MRQGRVSAWFEQGSRLRVQPIGDAPPPAAPELGAAGVCAVPAGACAAPAVTGTEGAWAGVAAPVDGAATAPD